MLDLELVSRSMGEPVLLLFRAVVLSILTGVGLAKCGMDPTTAGLLALPIGVMTIFRLASKRVLIAAVAAFVAGVIHGGGLLPAEETKRASIEAAEEAMKKGASLANELAQAVRASAELKGRSQLTAKLNELSTACDAGQLSQEECATLRAKIVNDFVEAPAQQTK